MLNTELKNFIDQVEKSVLTSSTTKKSDGVGVINSYKDGVIEFTGIKGVKMSEVIEVVETGTKAIVLNLEQNSLKALVIDDSVEIKEGYKVKGFGSVLSVSPSDDIIGRVVDSLYRPIDGGVALKQGKPYNLEKVSPGVFARSPVNKPLQTGIVSIDSLIPIGRGQRELIIGDRQTGKSSIAVDTILNQKNENIICIYCAIGQRESFVSKTYNTFKKEGALDYTLIVSASASTTATMQFLAPYTATSIAEYFLEKGKDVLIVYDDLSKHAVSYRELSLLLRRPPGREAYPGDVFYIHSRLLERSVKLNKENGGGSITSLPIIETQAGDVSAYIPTNVISITDGQIFLESALFNKGLIPAINVGLSVSRVGSAAQTKIMKKVAGTLKLDLASYYELEAFSQFSSELDSNTKKTLNRGKKIVSSFVQDQYKPYKLWEQVLIIYAVTNGYFDKVSDEQIKPTISVMLLKFKDTNEQTIKNIEEKQELTSDIEQSIAEFLRKHFK